MIASTIANAVNTLSASLFGELLATLTTCPLTATGPSPVAGPVAPVPVAPVPVAPVPVDPVPVLPVPVEVPGDGDEVGLLGPPPATALPSTTVQLSGSPTFWHGDG